MSANLTPQNWLASTKKVWGLLMQVAVFILGVASGFLVGPPGWASSADDKTVVRLGQFIVAVLAGLIFLLVQKWNKKKHTGRWAMYTIVFLALSIVAFFVYQHLLDTRTCQYAGQAVVIGTQHTEHARSYVSENPNSTCSSLLDDFSGQAGDIWTRDSINKSRYILAGTYILTLPLLTICIIAVIQAISCSQAKPRR
jgi:hypothetical protein